LAALQRIKSVLTAAGINTENKNILKLAEKKLLDSSQKFELLF
jgi:hypothetical protein